MSKAMRPTLSKPKHYTGAGESTPLLLLSSIYIPGSKNVKVPTALLERQRALQEPGVGKAAHLIKDAVMGYQDAPYEGTLFICFNLNNFVDFRSYIAIET